MAPWVTQRARCLGADLSALCSFTPSSPLFFVLPPRRVLLDTIPSFSRHHLYFSTGCFVLQPSAFSGLRLSFLSPSLSLPLSRFPLLWIYLPFYSRFSLPRVHAPFSILLSFFFPTKHSLNMF